MCRKSTLLTEHMMAEEETLDLEGLQESNEVKEAAEAEQAQEMDEIK
eukprot:g7107.t1